MVLENKLALTNSAELAREEERMTKLRAKKLFVIGNGFDRAHGLKTEFKDFKEYVFRISKLDNSEVEEEAVYDFEIPTPRIDPRGDQIYDDGEVAKKYYQILSYLNSDYDDWRNFEKNLSTIDKIDFYTETFEDNDGDLDCWKQSAYIENLGEDLKNFYKYATDYFFGSWIKSIYYSAEYSNVEISKSLLLNEKESYFLTFNYTLLLEELYKIEKDFICHIHGSIQENSFIVGHGRNIDSTYDEAILVEFDSQWDLIIQSVRKPVEKCFEKNKKYFEKLTDITELYVVGFNLDSIETPDSYYFKYFFSKNHIQIVFIDNFDKDKKEEIEETLKDWSKNEYLRVEFIDFN